MTCEQLPLSTSTELKSLKTLKHGGVLNKFTYTHFKNNSMVKSKNSFNDNLKNKIKGKRKTKRPLFKNKSVHLVFKSSKAVGKFSLFQFNQQIKSLLLKRSKTDYFQILDFVNMGNHLHCHLKLHDVKKFKNFLKVFPGLIAKLVTKAKKGKPFGKFWDSLVFSRVLTSVFEI